MKITVIVISIFLIATVAYTMIAATEISLVKAEIPHGAISIAFDDNYQNQFDNAFQLMQDYGIVGTFYVVTDHVGLSGYMNYAELQTLQNSGNEIGSHSKTHTTFTSMSEAEIRQECSLSKQALENHGLTVTNFAFPNGPTNETVDSIVSEYYTSGRTAYVEPYLMDIPTTEFRVSGFSAELPLIPFGSALSLLENMVDQVYSTNGFAIIFFHNIITNGESQYYTTSTADFESFLQYVINKGVQTLTVREALDLTSFSITSNYGTVTPTNGSYTIEETISIEAFAPSAGDGERYVWLGWNGSGAGSYSGFANSASIIFDGPINQTGLWRRDFELSIQADYGTTSPSSGEYWYEAGSSVTIEVVPPSSVNDERFFFEGWKGTGVGSYSGLSTTASIIMNSAISQSASVVHQYKIAIVASGVGSDVAGSVITIDGLTCAVDTSIWLDIGSHEFKFESMLEINSGKRYVLEACSGLSTQKSGFFLVSGPDTLSATYKTQFILNVVSLYGDSVGAGWYDSGSTAYAALNRSIIELSGKRHLFMGWSGNALGNNLVSDSILMDGPKNTTAMWKTQFLVMFSQVGLPNDYDASIILDSVNHKLPFSIWVDDGVSISFVYPEHLQSGFGVYYSLEDTVNQSIEVDSAITVTARYMIEYAAWQFALLLTLAMLLLSVVFWLVWKRRRKTLIA